MTTKKKRSEKLDMAKHFYREWEYRHKLYWGLLFKSVSAIITISAVPYILALANNLVTVLWLFPVLGMLLCIGSLLLLNSEHVRLRATQERIDNLLESVSNEYKTCVFEQRLFRKIISFKIGNIVLLIYVFMFILLILQLILILSGNFDVGGVNQSISTTTSLRKHDICAYRVYV